VSIAGVNDLELHSVDVEQAFTQADKLKEEANGRYFITPSPAVRMLATTCSVAYEVLKPLYGNIEFGCELFEIVNRELLNWCSQDMLNEYSRLLACRTASRL
jgi:hypothetical protein